MFRSLRSKSGRTGLTTSFPSMRPTRAPAIGPVKGISEIESAAEAPIMARIPVSFSLSAERTVATIWISLYNPCGKRGRMGRSIMREVRISKSESLASRLRKPPGIFPTAEVFST